MLVSIIIPVYNTSAFLCKCIDSVLNQTYSNLEIIIVNDGSTDNSLDLLNKYNDERISIISKTNGGLSSARNYGISLAKGEYLLHVDSDDYIEPGYVEDMVKFALVDDLDIVVTSFYIEADDGEFEVLDDLYLEDRTVISSQEYLDMFFDSNQNLASPVVWNKLIKTSIYKKNWIKHPINISLGEDLFVTPLLAKNSKRIGKLKKPYYHYMYNPDSITRSSMTNKIYQVQYVLESLQIHFKDRNLDGIYLRHLKPRMKELNFSELIKHKYRREIWDYLYVLEGNKYIFGSYTLFILYRLSCLITRPLRKIHK